MKFFEQVEKYGIRNPYGTDPMEGDWAAIAMSDGNEICGTLTDVGIFDFTLKDEDGKEQTYLLNHISSILDVERAEA